MKRKGGQYFQPEAGLDAAIPDRDVFPLGWERHVLSSFWLLVLAAHAVPNSVNIKPGTCEKETGAKLQADAFCWLLKKGSGWETRNFYLLRTFSQRRRACVLVLFFFLAPRAVEYLLLLSCLLPTVASAQCSHQEFECQYLCLEMNGKVFVTQRQSFFK